MRTLFSRLVSAVSVALLFMGYSGNSFAYSACDPYNVVLPCTSPSNIDMDSFIGVSDRIAFYDSRSTTINDTENSGYWTLSSTAPDYGYAQYYFYSASGNWASPDYVGGNGQSYFLIADAGFNRKTAPTSLKWPLTGTFASRTVNLAFGATWTYGECPSSTYKKHGGTDVNATSGEDVYAAHDGIVKAIYDATADGWAYAIVVQDTSNFFTTVYWHVNAYGGLAINDTVTKGQKIATVANLGSNTHFHFGIRIGAYHVNFSLVGALPVSACGTSPTYPAYPENLIDPATMSYQ